MRYYEQKYPEVDELVMVQVRQIAEMGAYVKLVRLLLWSKSSYDSLGVYSSSMIISKG